MKIITKNKIITSIYINSLFYFPIIFFGLFVFSIPILALMAKINIVLFLLALLASFIVIYGLKLDYSKLVNNHKMEVKRLNDEYNPDNYLKIKYMVIIIVLECIIIVLLFFLLYLAPLLRILNFLNNYLSSYYPDHESRFKSYLVDIPDLNLKDFYRIDSIKLIKYEESNLFGQYVTLFPDSVWYDGLTFDS